MIDYRENNRWKVYIHIVPKEISGYEWDKYYVGITCQDLKKRWGNGLLYKKSHLFYAAIQKYDWVNIEHEIIASNLTEEEAYAFEKQLIKSLKSNDENYGYNLTSGGKGSPSVKPKIILDYQKDESKKEISKEKYMELIEAVNKDSLFYMKNNCLDYEKYEIWKPVIGYEGTHEVSNFGRVRSLDHYVKHGRWNDGTMALKKGKLLNEKDNGHGYQSVHLTLNGKSKDFYIHRLVAMAFLENPNNLPEVNHKDNNSANNCLDNLEWCTPKYNDNYGLHKYAACKPVVMLTYEGKYVDEFISVTEAERLTGAKGVSAVCRGNRNSAGGYRWKYKEDFESGN